MPRIRSIKPEFWNDEKVPELAFAARLTFIGLWNLSDDYGVVRSNPKWVRSQLYPYDESLRTDQVSQWLESLVHARMLVPLTLKGEGYFYIRTFRDHQKVEYPSQRRNCTEGELQAALEEYRKGEKIASPNPHRILTEDSPKAPRRIGIQDQDRELDGDRDPGLGAIAPALAGRAGKRAPNPIWDCLCEAFGLQPVTKSEKTRLGRMVREFTEKGATPEEIRLRGSRYRQRWAGAAFTPEALFKHWDTMGQSTGTGINGASVDKAAIQATMDKVLREEANGF